MKNRFKQSMSSLLALLIITMCISPGFVAEAATLKVDITKDGEVVTTRLEVQEYGTIQLGYTVVSGELPAGAYTDWTSDLPLLAGVDSTGKVTAYDYSKAAIFQKWLDENVRVLPLIGDSMAASIEKSLSDAGIDIETADTEAIVAIVRLTAGDTLADSLQSALDNMNVKIKLTIYDESGKSIATDTIEVVVTKIPIIGSVIPTGVHITNKRSVPTTVAVGAQVQLYGATTPVRLNQGVKFSMGSTAFDFTSKNYASCTSEGLVTFTAPGTATVRVNPSSDAYAWAIDTVTFTILDPEDYPLQSFEIFGETTVGEGETTQLAVHKPLPEGAYVGKVTWSIADPTIAVVDEYGNVTGIDGGSGINYSRTTTLTVTASGVSVFIPIKVTRSYSLVNKISSVEISGDTAVGIGTSMQFTGTIYPARVSTNSGIVKKWGLMNRETGVITFADTGSSVSNSYASINSNGVVTGLSSGTVTIVFRATLENSAAQDTMDILIGKAITNFSLTGTATVTEGNTTQILMASILPADYDPELLENVVWSVADPKIASVNENGLVTGLDAGGSTLFNTKKTMVYATVGGVTRSIEITVRGSTIAYFTSANIKGADYLIVDFPYTYSAVSTPERVKPSRHFWGAVRDDGSQPWSASNTMGSLGIPFTPNVENEHFAVDVETGKATAKKPGSTTLYHYMAYLYTTYENITKTIEVIEIEPKSITITAPAKTTYIEGATSLDLSGLEVNLTYNRSDIEKYYGDTSGMFTDPQLTVNVSDYTISEINPTILDAEQFILVTVMRAGKSYRAVFGITLESKKVDTIEIISEPKYAYKEGETELDITGLKVKANYLNAESEEVSDFVVDGNTFDPLLLDTVQQITVTYTHAGISAFAYFPVIVYGVPVVSVDTGGYLGQWTKDDVTFTLDSTHKLDGITYYYSENGAQWEELLDNTLTVTENTDTVYSFKAVNGALQESEETIAYIVRIDKVNPDFTLTPAVYTVINTDYDIAIDYTVTGLSGIIETLVNGVDITGQNAFAVTENGVYTVTVKAGTGAAATHEIEVNNIDKERPRVTGISFEQINTGTFARIINTITFGIFFNDRIEFTFEAQDDGVAGIERIEYRFLDKDAEPLSDWKEYDSSSKPTQDPDFKGFAAVRAIDKATNVSDVVRSDGYVIDGTNPTDINIGAAFNSSVYESGKWVNDNVEITLSSYAFSDIYKYYVRTDSGEWTVLSSNLYTASLHGSHRYEFKAESYSGLESEISSINVNIDKIKPIIRVEFSGTFGRWTSDDISFSFSIQEEVVSGITYFLDKGEGWEEITTGSELLLFESTKADYRFKAVNGAGVESVPSDLYRVMFDKTTPDIIFVKSVTDPTIEPYSVALNVISGPSGISVITMDGVDITGQESITVSENGVYLFTLKSVSGNYAAKNLIIDNFLDPEFKVTDIEICELDGSLYSGTIDGIFGRCFIAPKISIKAINTGTTGIKHIEYRLLDKDLTEALSWTLYDDDSRPVISDSFTGYVQARVTDLSDNVSEELLSYGFTVDTGKPTAPFITATVNGAVYEGGWTGSAVEIALFSTAYSGILRYEYKEGAGEWTALIGNKLSVKNDGETAYEFRAVSSVGTFSDASSFSTKIEANIPVLQIGVNGTIGRKTGESITFNLFVSNQNSAVAYFYNNGGEWIELPSNTLVLDETQKAAYTFKAVNSAGVESAVSLPYEVDIDKSYIIVEKKPILSVSVNGALGRYTHENVIFNFTSTDTEGDVTYYYDNGCGFALISGSTLTLSENQNKQYVFKAIDESGKSSIISESFAVMIDKTVPSVEITEDTALSNNEMKIADVIIGSCDSGIKSVTVNGENITGVLQFTANSNGVYTVIVITNSGIVIEKTFTVSNIDNTVPVLTVYADGKLNSFTNEKVTFILAAISAYPDITYYYDDGTGFKALTGNVLTVNENTESTYRFKAVNAAGTESAVSDEYIVKIDKEKPVVTAAVKTTDGTNAAPVITVNAAAASGIAEILYCENGEEWHTLIGNELTAKDGVNAYLFKAVSVSGMTSDIVSFDVRLKLSPNSELLISKNYNAVILYETSVAASSLKAQFTNANMAIFRGDTRLSENDVVGTGCEIRLIDSGVVVDSLDIIVKGDINGDGVVDAIDVFLCDRAINGHATLEGLYYVAANVDETVADIDVSDYSAILNRSIGKSFF